MSLRTITLKIDENEIPVTVNEQGSGPNYLLLHGGGGPQTVAGFAEMLTKSGAHVVAPTHPGFGSTDRPDALHTIPQLAQLYLNLLDELGLDEVTIVGNSLGGWIAAEIALLKSAQVARLIIIDGVGIEVDGHPVIDFFSIPVEEITQYSFHDSEKFRMDPATMPPALLAALPGNRASLGTYAGESMSDNTLKKRLGGVTIATLVLWGDADRIVDIEYGRAFTAAIPGAEFKLLSATGHLPQLETPQQVLEAVRHFGTANQPNDSNTWTHEYAVETDVKPAALWASVRALRTGELPSANGDHLALQGPFAVGSVILTKPEGLDQTLSSRIVDLVELQTFAIETEFNGLTLMLRYEITENGGATKLTLILGIGGPGADELGPRIGPRISADYPEAADEIIKVARENFS